MRAGETAGAEICLRARPPRGWRGALARMPVWLYRARLGWLLGRRILLLTHTGRRSGRPRRTVLEVMRFDPESAAWYVASAFGEQAEWFRNILRNPAVMVETGRLRFPALAERLSAEEAAREFAGYARRHPLAARLIARLLRYPVDASEAGFARLGGSVPVVALRPRG